MNQQQSSNIDSRLHFIESENQIHASINRFRNVKIINSKNALCHFAWEYTYNRNYLQAGKKSKN